MERQWLGDPGNIWLTERIDAEKADEPLVQQQLVSEFVRFLAIGGRFAGALGGSFGSGFFGRHGKTKD